MTGDFSPEIASKHRLLAVTIQRFDLFILVEDSEGWVVELRVVIIETVLVVSWVSGAVANPTVFGEDNKLLVQSQSMSQREYGWMGVSQMLQLRYSPTRLVIFDKFPCAFSCNCVGVCTERHGPGAN
jgi:hypothetical protein